MAMRHVASLALVTACGPPHLSADGGTEGSNLDGSSADAMPDTEVDAAPPVPCSMSGMVDTSFGVAGFAPVGSGFGVASGVALMPGTQDIIVGGMIGRTRSCAFMKFTANGALDASFGNAGVRLVDAPGYDDCSLFDVAVMEDGRIVGVGMATNETGGDPLIIRLLATGDLDLSLSADGIQIGHMLPLRGHFTGVKIDDSDRIVTSGYVAASTDPLAPTLFSVARHLPDGSLDATFSGTGHDEPFVAGFNFASDVAITADGRIVVAGHVVPLATNEGTFAVARYLSDGQLDQTFSGDGLLTLVSGTALGSSLAPGGATVAVGAGSTGPVIARFDSAGSLDAMFGVQGVVTQAPNAGFQKVITDANGAITLVGSEGTSMVPHLLVAKYHPDGTADTSFGQGGAMNVVGSYTHNLGTDLVAQADGKIIAVGSSGTPVPLVQSWLVTRVCP